MQPKRSFTKINKACQYPPLSSKGKCARVILVLLVNLIWGAILTTFVYAGSKGDVNDDGAINILDVTRTTNIILGRAPAPTSYELWASDFNSDGVTNILDITNITNVILGKRNPPPLITSITPTSGTVGTAVTITGKNFGAAQRNGLVKFNNLLATVSSWNNTTINATIPSGATTGPVTVIVDGIFSNGFDFSVSKEFASKYILASEGGTIELGDGAKIEIPQESLARDTLITIEVSTNPPPVPTTLGIFAASKIYNFSPENLAFRKNVNITIPFMKNNIPQNFDKKDLLVYYWTGSNWINELNLLITKIDSTKNEINFSINHFTHFSIFGDNRKKDTDPAERQFDFAFNIWNWYFHPSIGPDRITNLYKAISEFNKVINNYPTSQWALRSRYFIGDCYAKIFVFSSHDLSNYDTYIKTLEIFDQAISYWEDFLNNPEPAGPSSFWVNYLKYPKRQDAYKQFAEYCPYGKETYKYLRDLKWFTGINQDQFRDPLPLLSTTRIVWSPADDDYDGIYSNKQTKLYLPKTINNDIEKEMNLFQLEGESDPRWNTGVYVAKKIVNYKHREKLLWDDYLDKSQ